MCQKIIQVNNEKDIENIISVSSKMKQYNGRLISPRSMQSDDTNTDFKRCKRHRAPKDSVIMSLMGCLT